MFKAIRNLAERVGGYGRRVPQDEVPRELRASQRVEFLGKPNFGDISQAQVDLYSKLATNFEYHTYAKLSEEGKLAFLIVALDIAVEMVEEMKRVFVKNQRLVKLWDFRLRNIMDAYVNGFVGLDLTCKGLVALIKEVNEAKFDFVSSEVYQRYLNMNQVPRIAFFSSNGALQHLGSDAAELITIPDDYDYRLELLKKLSEEEKSELYNGLKKMVELEIQQALPSTRINILNSKLNKTIKSKQALSEKIMSLVSISSELAKLVQSSAVPPVTRGRKGVLYDRKS